MFGRFATFAALLVGLTLAPAGMAQAQSIRIGVDSSLADYLLDAVCSGEPLDEAYVRSLPVVQSQVKHHTGLSATRDMDAFVEGLKAAAACRVPEKDVYLFGPLVEEKEKFREEVAFFKERSAEIESYVAETLAPYAPDDLDYEGALVVSVVGNNCGGFSMDGRFYLALNCLRDSYEEEYETAKLLSAHETYHAIQYAFFHPFDEDINRVKTVDDAFDYLFMNLLLEGTAELAADSRALTGSGRLTDFMKDMARGAYRNLPLHIRNFGYAGDILAAGGDVQRRIRDIYETGFTGGGGQVFYYVGAFMGRVIEETYSREALVCILALPPEQYVRAYQAAAKEAERDDAPPLSAAMEKAADRLSKKRGKDQRYEACIRPQQD
ncbi:DUF5700 domain-containing putative Zn-dependent protease [Hyphococcus sp.]|uniref:DUF5700 domain-containing putative Zn-dependent protease n=1 Tax=Hyphococcus sp. TaxID=2038636 RepID=UPI003D0CBDA4